MSNLDWLHWVLIGMLLTALVLVRYWRHQTEKAELKIVTLVKSLTDIATFKMIDQDDVYRLKDKAKQGLKAMTSEEKAD